MLFSSLSKLLSNLGFILLELCKNQSQKLIKMKIQLRNRMKLLKPTRISFLRILPILVFTFILLLSVSIGLADPTTGPLPPE